jgi:hypothetical protein
VAYEEGVLFVVSFVGISCFARAIEPRHFAAPAGAGAAGVSAALDDRLEVFVRGLEDEARSRLTLAPANAVLVRLVRGVRHRRNRSSQLRLFGHYFANSRAIANGCPLVTSFNELEKLSQIATSLVKCNQGPKMQPSYGTLHLMCSGVSAAALTAPQLVTLAIQSGLTLRPSSAAYSQRSANESPSVGKNSSQPSASNLL